MPKKIKKNNFKCTEHIFIMKATNRNCRYAQPVSVCFCEQRSDKSKQKIIKASQCLQCPIYNNDKNCITPTFILASEKQHYQERKEKSKNNNEKKIIQHTDQKLSLNIPKPRSKNNFCSVCRQSYQDYLQHIESQKHKKKINSSQFNHFILETAQKFNPHIKTPCNSCHHTLSTENQDVELLQFKAIKKIKTDTQAQRYTVNQNHARNNQIAPPPHLDINHTSYFPKFIPQCYPYMDHPITQSIHSITNPNIFMSPFINPSTNIYLNQFNINGMNHGQQNNGQQQVGSTYPYSSNTIFPMAHNRPNQMPLFYNNYGEGHVQHSNPYMFYQQQFNNHLNSFYAQSNLHKSQSLNQLNQSTRNSNFCSFFPPKEQKYSRINKEQIIVIDDTEN